MEVDQGKGKSRGKKGRSSKGKGKRHGKNKRKGKRRRPGPCLSCQGPRCFTAVVGLFTRARHRQRSEPNHVACKMAGNKHTEHKESRRGLVQLARISHDQRITFGTHQNRELRARRDPHERPNDTQLQYVSSIK